MYIDGHVDIVKDIINNHLPKNYFTDEIIEKDLFIGAKYPDIPCGKYKIKANGRIVFHRAKLCEVAKLFLFFITDITKKYNETKMFQYHKGYFAHLHSMSTDPENTVGKIRNKIITSILGYALLAVYDSNIFKKDKEIKPNTFWIGIILHIVTDAYSPSHTIRNDHKYKTIPIIPKTPELLKRLEIHESIKTLAKQTIVYNNKYIFQEALLLLVNNKSIYKHINRFWKIYKVFKFEYDINKMIHNTRVTTLAEKPGDIISFQHYDNQNFLFHSHLDLLHYVTSNKPLYNRMIHECIHILLLYKKAIETKNIEKFINDLTYALLNGTYRINKKNLPHKTNKIIVI